MGSLSSSDIHLINNSRSDTLSEKITVSCKTEDCILVSLGEAGKTTTTITTIPDRDLYLGFRFFILIVVFISVYLIIWLCQRQLTKAFKKSHESSSSSQPNRTIFCPLLFLIPVRNADRGGGGGGVGNVNSRRRCCMSMESSSYDIRDFIGWNYPRGNLHSQHHHHHPYPAGAATTGGSGSRAVSPDGSMGGGGGGPDEGFEIIEGSPPKYEEILLLQETDTSTPPTYEDATNLKNQQRQPQQILATTTKGMYLV